MKSTMNKPKETFLTLFVIISIIALIFYWTHLAFNNVIKSKQNEINIYKEKIQKVKSLTAKLKQNTSSYKRINGGLLSFFQNQTKKLGLEDKLIVIKPKMTESGDEAAIIRYEKLNFNEFIKITKLIDDYSDLKIKHLEISKRFDNPKLINLDMEILRLKN